MSKVLAKELRKDGELLAELVIAKELGYTLVELREKMTEEELYIWHAFLTLQREEEDKMLNKSKMRR